MFPLTGTLLVPRIYIPCIYTKCIYFVRLCLITRANALPRACFTCGYINENSLFTRHTRHTKVESYIGRSMPAGGEKNFVSVNRPEAGFAGIEGLGSMSETKLATFSTDGKNIRLLFLPMEKKFRYFFYRWKKYSATFSTDGKKISLLFLPMEKKFGCFFYRWKKNSAAFSTDGKKISLLFLPMEKKFRCFFYRWKIYNPHDAHERFVLCKSSSVCAIRSAPIRGKALF